MLNGVWLITSTDYLFWRVENGREFEWKGESRAHFPIAPGRSGYRSVRLAEWIVGYPEAIHLGVTSPCRSVSGCGQWLTSAQKTTPDEKEKAFNVTSPDAASTLAGI